MFSWPPSVLRGWSLVWKAGRLWIRNNEDELWVTKVLGRPRAARAAKNNVVSCDSSKSNNPKTKTTCQLVKIFLAKLAEPARARITRRNQMSRVINDLFRKYWTPAFRDRKLFKRYEFLTVYGRDFSIWPQQSQGRFRIQWSFFYAHLKMRGRAEKFKMWGCSARNGRAGVKLRIGQQK